VQYHVNASSRQSALGLFGELGGARSAPPSKYAPGKLIIVDLFVLVEMGSVLQFQ